MLVYACVCVGVGEVVSRGSTSWSGAGAFVCKATVGWVAYDDSICGEEGKRTVGGGVALDSV